MKIPSDLILSKFHPKISKFCSDNKINTDTYYDCLLLFLLYEDMIREKFLTKENSSIEILNEYFNSFPKDFPSFPLNYDEHELGILKPTFFYKRIERFKIEFEKSYEKIAEYLSKLNLSLDKEKFMIHYLILSSRSFGLDTEDGTFDSLVPYGDMFNTSIHDTERSSFWYFDVDKNFHVESGLDITTGEEI